MTTHATIDSLTDANGNPNGWRVVISEGENVTVKLEGTRLIVAVSPDDDDAQPIPQPLDVKLGV